MINSKKMEAYLQENLTSYLDMLRQMVAINSFTANPAGVNALADLTADLFAPLGLESELIQSENPHYGHHLVMTKKGKSDLKIGMVSHLDTVFPAEEEHRHSFHWRKEGDRIYGPGTVDIKGGTIVMYMMLDAIKTLAPELYDAVTWVLLLDASEETDGQDFGELCLARLKGDNTLGCLIFEGGLKFENKYKIVVARKGMAIFQIEVEGKASHAGSSHQNGANAIVQLGQTIQQVAAVTDYEKDITVNVGTVSGGTVTNRVPHQAEAWLEMRTFKPDVYDTAVANIKSYAGPGNVKTFAGDFACQVDITQTRKTKPWPRNEATDHLFAVWKAAGDELGFEVIEEERGGLSDGNYFWDQLPSVDGLGPSGANAHCSEQSEDGSKVQEFCEVSSFVPKTVLNVTAVLKLIQAEV